MGPTKINLKRVTDWDISDGIRHDYIFQTMRKAGYTYLGQGRHRMTFIAPHKRFVLKLPRNLAGVFANQREYQIWSTHTGKPAHGIRAKYATRYAPCRLIQNTILMMRTVVKLYGTTGGCTEGRHTLGGSFGGNRLPEWASNIECVQVGKLANGKWAAYDYAE